MTSSFRIETIVNIIQTVEQPTFVGSNIILSSATPTDAIIDVGNITIGNKCSQSQQTNNPINFNTSIGFEALAHNMAPNNVAVGVLALNSNEDGRCNTAIGSYSLAENKGNSNTAVGFSSLPNLVDGDDNTVLGNYAGPSIKTGNDNIIIGSRSDVFDESSSNQIIIGNSIKGLSSNQIILGNPFVKSCFIAGIRSASIQDSSLLSVYVNNKGQLTTISSSSKAKHNIAEIGDVTDSLYQLKPISFNYDADDRKSYGLMTEDVERVFPDILARESVGSVKTVQYHLLIPLMLNMIIRLKDKVEEQAARIDSLMS